MTSQNSSDLPFLPNCMLSKPGLYVMSSYSLAWTLLIFPLYFLVFLTGFRRWRQNRRYTVSHTDFFTYHSFPFEFLICIGYIILAYTSLHYDYHLYLYGLGMLIFAGPGVLSAQMLTCIERYIAVVYPVVYLSLRKQQWARNLIILVVWLICPPWTIWYLSIEEQNQYYLTCAVVGFVTCVIIFCSTQVLRILRTAAPGDGKGVSQSKQRAFYTMLAILSVLMLWLVSGILSNVLEKMSALEADVMCTTGWGMCLFKLPSGLVLPLLFLHRAGKRPKRNK